MFKTISMQEVKDRFQFIDEALHPNALINHHLHLHLSPAGLAYSIYNPAKNNFAASATYPNVNSQMQMDLIFSKDQWLRSSYQLVKVMFTNHLFTFIPNDIFDEYQIPQYLNFNLLDPDSFFQERNDMTLLGAQNIFCLNREPKIVVNKYHPNNKVYHSSTPLIEGLLSLYGKSSGVKFFIFSWNDNDMELVVLENGKLILYNYFQVNSKEEFIYFPLYVCQQLKFKRDDVEVIAGGILDKHSVPLVMLATYFKNIKFSGLPEGFNYSQGFAEKTGNMAWSMITLALCE